MYRQYSSKAKISNVPYFVAPRGTVLNLVNLCQQHAPHHAARAQIAVQNMAQQPAAQNARVARVAMQARLGPRMRNNKGSDASQRRRRRLEGHEGQGIRANPTRFRTPTWP
jgi:hypothetical protein